MARHLESEPGHTGRGCQHPQLWFLVIRGTGCTLVFGGMALIQFLSFQLQFGTVCLQHLVSKLHSGADCALRSQLDSMQRAFAAKRLASSEHVTIWSSKAIVEDWEGYRRAARRIWVIIDEQMDLERRHFE